jgi:hypothetical protein
MKKVPGILRVAFLDTHNREFNPENTTLIIYSNFRAKLGTRIASSDKLVSLRLRPRYKFWDLRDPRHFLLFASEVVAELSEEGL